ncbi:hypothetical protein ACMZ6Y_09485 [Streptococcus pluranimalium]
MTTREIAIIIWGIVFLLWLLYSSRKNRICRSLIDILSSVGTVLKLPLSQWIVVTNTFVIVLVYSFSQEKLSVSYWYIKDYVIVFLFTVFPTILLLKEHSVLEIVINKGKELLFLNTILLFIRSTYTFSLPIELLIVFLLIILSTFSAISDTKKEFQQIGKLFSFFLSLLGTVMLFGATKEFLNNISDIRSFDFWLFYAFELLVIVINIPMLYIAQKMIVIKNMIAHSDYPNTIFSFVRYYCRWYWRKIKFKKLIIKDCVLDVTVEKYIFGYPKISVYSDKESLSKEEILNFIAIVILKKYKLKSLSRRIDKFPVYIEIVDKEKQTIALWTEEFLSQRNRFYNPFLDKDTKEIYPSILILQ